MVIGRDVVVRLGQTCVMSVTAVLVLRGFAVIICVMRFLAFFCVFFCCFAGFLIEEFAAACPFFLFLLCCPLFCLFSGCIYREESWPPRV